MLYRGGSQGAHLIVFFLNAEHFSADSQHVILITFCELKSLCAPYLREKATQGSP